MATDIFLVPRSIIMSINQKNKIKCSIDFFKGVFGDEIEIYPGIDYNIH